MTGMTIDSLFSPQEQNRRGSNLYNLTQRIGVSARDKTGKLIQVAYDRPYFTLTLNERVDMARFSSMVFGVVANRMHRIGSLDWNIVTEEEAFEEDISIFEDMFSVWQEWSDVPDLKAITMRQIIYSRLRKHLPELRSDMQNFKASLNRYVKRSRRSTSVETNKIRDWLIEPNPDYSFEEYLKLWVWDLHVHGVHAMYKQLDNDGLVDNLYALPGGSVVPIQNKFVGGATGYLQMIPVETTPQIMFNDELCFSRWLPTTSGNYGLVPLESLVNKVAEQLLFDDQAATQADGTKPPEKIVVFGENSPFGDLDTDLSVPMDNTEQKKIETVFNEYRKSAIRTLSGVGTPIILDISKSDQFAKQAERQKQLKEDVGLVFGASNMEMNLSGSDDTSGRATSESEERMDMKRGITPILRIVEEKLNRDVLPYRYGPGFRFKFTSGMSEAEEIKLTSEKLSSGLYSTNEIRIEKGETPFPEDQYDRPPSQQVSQESPEGKGESGSPW